MVPDSASGEAHVTRSAMFRSGAGGQHVALQVSMLQMEGYAAARGGVPVDAHGVPVVGAPMHDVEVAWENYLEGLSGRARLGDAGSFDGKDNTKPDSLDALHIELISITSHGLFLRPHVTPGANETEYFVDTRGRVERYVPPRWPSISAFGVGFRVETDAEAIDGELLGVALLQAPGGELVTAGLAHRVRDLHGTTWRFLTKTILPAHKADSGLVAQARWASSVTEPLGIASLVADPRHARAWAYFLGITKGGAFLPEVPLATLFDLGDRPRPCMPSDRARGVRFSVPFQAGPEQVIFPGMRHPVIITARQAKTAVGVDEPILLLTSDAVLFGDPTSPCIAAWEGESVGRALVSALIPGDLERGWLFRLLTDPVRANGNAPSGTPPPTLEYRPMSCRFDPAARVPESVWNERGTTAP